MKCKYVYSKNVQTFFKSALTLSLRLWNTAVTHRNQNTKQNMRTKTVLLTAAVIAAGIAASQAQVYSVNAVGYVNLSLPAGFSMIANPLNGTNNNLSTILPSVPNNTTIYRFNPTTQSFADGSTFFVDEGVGIWFPDAALPPGEGAFISLPAPTTLTFVGEVPQGTLVNPVPSNFSIRSSIVPQAGALSSALGFPAQNGDTVYQWNRTTQQYNPGLSYFVDEGVGVWFPSEPNISVGEGFFVQNTGAARQWTRTFNVNN
jgi:hypothetical protein